jgi:hypothetical protein
MGSDRKNITPKRFATHPEAKFTTPKRFDGHLSPTPTSSPKKERGLWREGWGERWFFLIKNVKLFAASKKEPTFAPRNS